MELTTLTLRTAPGRRDDLIAHYREAGILEASGALSSHVLVPEDEPDTVVVIAEWVDADACAAWQNSPDRRRFAQGMASFFDSADGIRTRRFRIVHSSPAA